VTAFTRRELFAHFIRPRERGEEELHQPPLPPKEWLPGYLRPPGASPESQFVKDCTGCGECTKACPENAILPLGPAYGDADKTPAILPSAQPCRLCPDQPCVTACEPGALRAVPFEETRMGSLKIASERCWAAMGQPCDYCVTACPLSPPALQETSEGVAFVEDRCIGCGLCLYYCTATPRAIEIEVSGEMDRAPSVANSD